MSQKKGIAVLGSTGGLGSQVLEVLSKHSNRFDIQVLSGNTQTQRLIEQAKTFQPNIVVVADEDAYHTVSEALWDEDIHVYAGADALSQVVQGNDVQVVVNAIAGIEALPPSISAIEAKKDIIIGSTELLCTGGGLIQSLALKHNTRILPIDPCLSGILQGISGEYQNAIVSLVQFEDGQMKAQWANEDPSASLQYTLTYPHRVKRNCERFNFLNRTKLDLERPKLQDYPMLQLVYDALDAGGTMPCALYAANSVTLKAVEKNQITDNEWVSINEKVMHAIHTKGSKALEEIIETYEQATQMATDLCSR